MTVARTTSAVSSLERGHLLAGKYELEEALGQGAMGMVWRARNTALDVHVAIKILHPSADSHVLRERLLLEGKAAAQVGHAAIVKIFDIGETATGEPFVVMELLHGETLGAYLARVGRLPAVDAVRLLLPVADALRSAHEKGLVHRDVKPDNIFLAAEGGSIQPKLVDFGIVKVRRDSHLTEAGMVVGSPDYMSPEQARGQEDLNHLSDMWSLAVVLYELIAGEPPFHASNYNALMRQIVEREPRPLVELGVADQVLSEIVRRCLRKAPTQRFQSMSALGRALAAWLIEQGVAQDACGTGLAARWLQGPPPAKPRSNALATRPRWLGPRVVSLLGRIHPQRLRTALVVALAATSLLVMTLRLLGLDRREIPADSRLPRIAPTEQPASVVSDPSPAVRIAPIATSEALMAPPASSARSASSKSASQPRSARRPRAHPDLLEPY